MPAQAIVIFCMQGTSFKSKCGSRIRVHVLAIWSGLKIKDITYHLLAGKLALETC